MISNPLGAQTRIFSNNLVSIMVDNAFSYGILHIMDKQVFVFHKDGFQLHVQPQFQELHFFNTNSAQYG